jgi:tetratricopeptide (TPR) repeat protein
MSATDAPRDKPAHAPSVRWWASPWFAAAVGAVCSLNTLWNDFTYDDISLVRENARIRTLAEPASIWLSDWWKLPNRERGMVSPDRDLLYRPLTLFTFALDYALSGLRPAGYHAVNIGLHALCCALVCLLARRLFDSELVAGVSALLFAVHPVHAEAVASIVGRAELLSALFLLLGLLALLSERRGLWRILLACAAFAAALLAKETAVCYLPVALLVMHFTQSGRNSPRRWLSRAALLLIPIALYLALRAYALGGHLIRTGESSVVLNPLHSGDVSTANRVFGAFSVLGHYARLLVAPVDLSCDYGLATFDPASGATGITILGMAACLVLAVGVADYISRFRRRPRPLALLAAIFITSYALISNTVLLIGVSVAERLMYWPSVPACLAAGVMAAWLGRHARSRQRVLAALGVVGLVAFGLRTVTRNADWRNNRTLFEADARAHPENVQLSTALARLILYDADHADNEKDRTRLLDEADRLLNGALSRLPRFALALRHRGEVELLRGRPEAARSYFEQVLQLNPADPIAWAYLADLGGRPVDDLGQLEAVVADDPDNAAARVTLGRALLAAGRADAAVAQFRAAVSIAPDAADIARALAEVLVTLGLRDEAREAYQRLVVLAPNDWASHANLTALLANSDPDAALVHAIRAHELAPTEWRAKHNLAEAYALFDRNAEAAAMLREAVALLPEGHPALPAIRERIAALQGGG